MIKILLADPLDKEALEELKAIPEFDVTVKTGMDEAELIRTIPEYEVIVVRSATKVTRKVIEAAKNLKLIIRAGIGLDNIDVEAAQEKHIEVANTPAATSISVAELTLGLMLAVARNLGRAYQSMKEHRWEKKALSGIELYGKTLGIIGFGRIGQEVAKRALAFGMKVIAYDILEIKTDLPVKLVSLEELLSQADIISLHVPLTKETKYLLSRPQFEKMKKGVILINAARGGVVDEAVLLEALNSGQVKAAALDVFEKEPPVDFTLIDHPQVFPTPHIGAAAEEGQRRAGFEVVKILRQKYLSS